MNNLKESLQNLVDQFIVNCVIEERAKSDGYKVIFQYVIPSSCLKQLVGFSDYYSFSYYISAADDCVLFNIYRDL